MSATVRHIFPPSGGAIVGNADFAGYLREVAILVENGYYPKVDAMVVLLSQHVDDGGHMTRLSCARRGTNLDTHKLAGMLDEAKYKAFSEG